MGVLRCAEHCVVSPARDSVSLGSMRLVGCLTFLGVISKL